MRYELVKGFYAYQQLVQRYGLPDSGSIYADMTGNWYHAPPGFRPVGISPFAALQLMASNALAWWRDEHGGANLEINSPLSDPGRVLQDLLDKVIYGTPHGRGER